MRFVGLDVHKREIEACVIDEHGKIRQRTRFASTRLELTKFFTKLEGSEVRVALEATTNTWGVAAVVEPLVAELVISNPLRTKAIAEAKIKTDKVDALVLAQLLRADFLPRVWIPDENTRTIRGLCTHRAGLVADRTRFKNRIHSLLAQRLIEVPVTELFSKAGREWLGTVELEDDARAFVDTQIDLLQAVEEKICAADEALAVGGRADPRVALLVTLPGVDIAVAQTLIAALGDITRFKTPDHAASYLGIVPSTRQSGDHCYHGPITKQGRGHARWMLVQAAQHVGNHPGPLGVFFRRLQKKKNRNIAVVATARKLVTIAWHMLRNNEPYRYAQPTPTAAKLARLRVRGGGERRKTGPKKNTRPRKPGAAPTRRVPSIAEVYEKEGLPNLRPAPGEHNAIERFKLARYVASISKERRVPRRPKE